MQSINRCSFFDQITEKDETLKDIEKGNSCFFIYLFMIFYETLYHLIINIDKTTSYKTYLKIKINSLRDFKHV